VTARARRAAAVDLACITGGVPVDAATALGAWGALGQALWPAWSAMPHAEMDVYDALGEEVGQKLLVLWAISRFRDSGLAGPALSELVDEGGRPRFGDPLVEDMMLAAFALGAAWAEGRRPATALDTAPRPHLRLAEAPPRPA